MNCDFNLHPARAPGKVFFRICLSRIAADGLPGQRRGRRRRRLTIDLETPNGFRYQRMEMLVAAAGSTEIERSLKGYPFPAKVQPLKPSEDCGKKTQIVEVRLPVADTAITESGPYGLSGSC